VSETPYPDGIDCVWIASDREGNLGAFITAGVGPIPVKVLKSDCPHVGDIEGLICTMPRVTGAHLFASVPRPGDLIGFAERGLFVYDWTDIHRTAQESLKRLNESPLLWLR
jgi:hypothetical protein